MAPPYPTSSRRRRRRHVISRPAPSKPPPPPRAFASGLPRRRRRASAIIRRRRRASAATASASRPPPRCASERPPRTSRCPATRSYPPLLAPKNDLFLRHSSPREQNAAAGPPCATGYTVPACCRCKAGARPSPQAPRQSPRAAFVSPDIHHFVNGMCHHMLIRPLLTNQITSAARYPPRPGTLHPCPSRRPQLLVPPRLLPR